MYASVGRTFWENLRARGDAVALWTIDDDGDGTPDAISSQRLQGLAAQVAMGLIELELGPGDRVLIHAPLGPETLLLALATWLIGGVTVHADPTMPPAMLGAALGRMKPSWIVVPTPAALADLELASDDSLAAAHVIVLAGAPPEPIPRITSFVDVKALGRKSRATGIAPLAKAVFAVPGDARASILYWRRKSSGEMGAAALDHADLLAGLGTLPRAWGISASDRALLDVHTGTRRGLFAMLQLLDSGCALLLTGRHAQAVKPTILATNAEGMERIIADVESSMEGKLTTRVRERLGGDLDPARELNRHLGKSLRLAWCLDTPGHNVKGAFERAGIELVETP
jgi:hypothetical protein